MGKLLLLIIGAGVGWLVGLHFWMIFKLAGIVLGGILVFGALYVSGMSSGNSKEASYFAILGVPLIVGIISGWFAVSDYTIDGISSSISKSFSVEKLKENKAISNNNLAETLKQLEKAGVITINNKK